ncbi:mannitol-1-phosphate 5-dehydrogenase [Williamsoniiplasma luminosum]|uniref:Mannitol-1-phosphate 5-dehydrogenase n=1 Tax=Williamsoniiplasma luminosum TaxID=214888 RepID=A0A2K8NU05_9MOLU|nr:hypothetical protein [Williamsoniiplasma luminosum]ATZ17335.1 mannitol-1-phosphate 5-dehydrogenase [Williamsoniiplasma luminosum]
MKVLHFGAGNIGRGFIAPILLKDQNIEHIKFTDINKNMISHINEVKEFHVIELGETKNIIKIDNKISGVSNEDLFLNNDYKIDILTTSIGALALKYIEDIVVKIIKNKENNNEKLIIMCCENGDKVSSMFKQQIQKLYNFDENLIAFVDVMVDRIVPDQKKTNIIDIEVEQYYSWIVDETQWPTTIPRISSLKYSKNMDAEIAKKIWLLNGGHASLCWAAYKLNQFNPPFTNASLKIETLKKFLVAYLNEVGQIFSKQFNYDLDEVKKFINQTIERFENIYIQDHLERVGRNLILKLQLEERILKPFLLGQKLGLETKNIQQSILNALDYTNENDNDGKIIAQMHANHQTKAMMLKTIIKDITDEQIEFILNINN